MTARRSSTVTERQPMALAAARLSARPIRYIINTSAGADHVGGTSSSAPVDRPPRREVRPALGQTGGAAIVATENALLRERPNRAAVALSGGGVANGNVH
jgi:glyoxylase-like metal-dependent hydrolase (beta-lactamase superfamily II)